MTSDEYKAARKLLGYNVEQWINKLGIAIDTHKSMSSGRNPVMLPVQKHIETLLQYSDKDI